MITSTANQQVKRLLQLHKKAKLRNAQDVFVAEGIKMFREAPRERMEKAYVARSLWEKPEIKRMLEGAPFEVVEDSVFRVMSGTQTPQGILCILRQYHYKLEELLSPQAAVREKGAQKAARAPLFLVLENLQDPGNLGTILRTAEGAGVTGVLLNQESVDIYNPKSIRSTMGSVYRVPFLYVEDLGEALKLLKKHGVKIYGAHLAGGSPYDREAYKGGTAFLIGNESRGLSEGLAGCADANIYIPMEGKLESLNAAAAVAVLTYEACRQRRKGIASPPPRLPGKGDYI